MVICMKEEKAVNSDLFQLTENQFKIFYNKCINFFVSFYSVQIFPPLSLIKTFII